MPLSGCCSPTASASTASRSHRFPLRAACAWRARSSGCVGQAAEQVRQCLPGCLADLVEMLARASQTAFGVDQLVEAQDGLEASYISLGLRACRAGVRQEWPVLQRLAQPAGRRVRDGLLVPGVSGRVFQRRGGHSRASVVVPAWPSAARTATRDIPVLWMLRQPVRAPCYGPAPAGSGHRELGGLGKARLPRAVTAHDQRQPGTWLHAKRGLGADAAESLDSTERRKNLTARRPCLRALLRRTLETIAAYGTYHQRICFRPVQERSTRNRPCEPAPRGRSTFSADLRPCLLAAACPAYPIVSSQRRHDPHGRSPFGERTERIFDNKVHISCEA